MSSETRTITVPISSEEDRQVVTELYDKFLGQIPLTAEELRVFGMQHEGRALIVAVRYEHYMGMAKGEFDVRPLP